jgi:hypothetical protein
MSLELVDLRSKITVEADICLEAEALATGKDKSEVVREVLQAWALSRITVCNVVIKRLEAQGLGRDLSGTSGNKR